MTCNANRSNRFVAALNRARNVTEPIAAKIGDELDALADSEGWGDEAIDAVDLIHHFDTNIAPLGKGIFSRTFRHAIFAKGLRPVRAEMQHIERNFEGRELFQLLVWFEIDGVECALVNTCKDYAAGRFGLYSDTNGGLRRALGWGRSAEAVLS